MHITCLEISNFRGIQSLHLAPQCAITLLYGPNGTGKTSALDAIRYALTGIVKDQTGATLKLDRLVGPYADTTSITLGLAHKDKHMTVTAKISRMLRTTLETDPPLPGNKAEQLAGIWSYFNLNPQKGRLALDPLGLLLGTDILDGLTGGCEIDTARLQAALGDKHDLVVKTLSTYRIPLSTTADVAAAADTLYDLRTKVNRDIKSLDALLASSTATCPQTTKGRDITADDIPTIEDTLRKLLNERHELDRRLDRCKTARTQEQIDADEAAAREALSALRPRPVSCMSGPPSPRPPVPPEELEELRVAWRRAETDSLSATDALCKASETLNDLENDRLPVCPTCQQAVSRKTLEVFVAELDKKAEHLSAIHKDARAKYDHAYKLAQDYGKWEQEVAKVLEAHERAQQDVQRDYEHEKKRLEAEVAKIEKETAAEDVAAVQAARDHTQTKLESGQRLLDQWREWTQRQATQAEAAEKRVASQQMSDAIDLLRDPNTSRLLGDDKSMAFQILMNDALEIFGYQIRVNWEAKCIEMSEDAVKHWRPMREVSAGELTLAQVAVADVYGEESLALIDRFEGVDVEHREQVWNVLRVPIGGRVLAQTATTVEICGIDCIDVMTI